MGIGHELKTRGETWAKNKGAKLLQTAVFYENTKMIEFNKKLGFSTRTVEMMKELPSK